MLHAFADWFPWLRLPTVLIDPPSIVLLTGAAAGFALARFLLGLGEAGNFPASIKTVAEWFPRSERALATGVFNSGTNVGALLTPLIVPWITLRFGWQWAFVGTGLTGFVWLIWWARAYAPPEEHPRLSPQELAYIRSDPTESITPVPWASLLRYRQTWAFAIGKFLTDPIWWLYLFWIPDFLNKNYGLNLKTIGLPIVVIYLVADVGSIGGGWLSSSLLKRGWSVNAARKTAMLLCAVAVVPIMFAAQGVEPVGGRASRGAGGGRAPGLVGQPVHADLGHVSAPRRRIGRRHRRHGRGGWRHVQLARRRRDPAANRQLCAGVLHCRLRLPDRPRDCSRHVAATRARQGGVRGQGAEVPGLPETQDQGPETRDQRGQG